MKIYFVRHGETDKNKSLNDVGREQALRASREIEKIDVIFSSPLKRAVETAQILIGDSDVLIREELKEKNYGSFSGKSWKEISEAMGGGYGEVEVKLKFDYRPYGGESLDDVKDRINSFVSYVRDTYENKIVVAVTHAGIIRAAHFMFNNEEIQHLPNLSIHEFTL